MQLEDGTKKTCKNNKQKLDRLRSQLKRTDRAVCAQNECFLP